MPKAKMKPVKQFDSITVTKGPLAGLTFTVEDHTKTEKGRVRVKYVAPDNGPRAVVDHTAVRNEFRTEDRAENVRIAFAKLLPANILWSKENGYSERASGTLLVWDHQIARFVLRPTEDEPKAQGEEDGPGEELDS